jgi:hypothetical protein
VARNDSLELSDHGHFNGFSICTVNSMYVDREQCGKYRKAPKRKQKSHNIKNNFTNTLGLISADFLL